MKSLLVLWYGCIFASGAQAATLKFPYDFADQWKDGQWQGEWWQEPGLPEVPVVWAKVLLPLGEEASEVRFSPRAGRHGKLRGGVSLSPQPRPLCQVQLPAIPARAIDADVFFPNRLMQEPVEVTKHGFRMIYVAVFPVQVKPATAETFEVPAGELTVTTRTAIRRESHYRGLASDFEEVAALVDNPQVLQSYPRRARSRVTDYLMIAPKEYIDDPATLWFLSEKERRGITSLRIPIENIVSQGTGTDLQQKIRNTILSYYKSDAIQYVLLVGNGYQITPTRIMSVNSEAIPSDMYYGCLDGSGTGSNVDLACEVAVGRAPVSNLEEWQIFVTKTLRMQYLDKDDPRIWNEMNFGEKMDSTTLGAGLVEQLLKGGKAGSIATTGYPSQVKPTKLYETLSAIYQPQTVVDAINAGNFYTVNHMGHASDTYCMRFKDTYIPQLTNDLPFFGITQGCHPGDLRKPNWASKMVLKRDGGAGAYIANSSYGWYMPNQTDGPSNRHHLVFYDSVFREGIRQLGRANNRAKERLIPQVQASSTLRKVVYETNLLGDPELRLKF